MLGHNTLLTHTNKKYPLHPLFFCFFTCYLFVPLCNHLFYCVSVPATGSTSFNGNEKSNFDVIVFHFTVGGYHWVLVVNKDSIGNIEPWETMNLRQIHKHMWYKSGFMRKSEGNEMCTDWKEKIYPEIERRRDSK